MRISEFVAEVMSGAPTESGAPHIREQLGIAVNTLELYRKWKSSPRGKVSEMYNRMEASLAAIRSATGREYSMEQLLGLED